MLKDKIYPIVIHKYKNIQRIVILILLIIVVIELIMISRNAIEIIKNHKVYKQYEAQLIALSKQEEDNHVEIEKKKQEKIPKLTRRRKAKHRKYLSFRNEKSISNF